MTRKTYCGNLLWQSGLTLLASKCFLGVLVSMAVATAHGAENAQVADCVKGPVHAREFIIRDSSGQYSELKPMLGNSFGERLELWGVVDKQTNARTGVEYTLRLERPDIKEKIYVRGDKALLDQVCNRKIWMVGYESVSEISPFEQRSEAHTSELQSRI